MRSPVSLIWSFKFPAHIWAAAPRLTNRILPRYLSYGACAIHEPRGLLQLGAEFRLEEEVAMKQFCVLAVVLALALAEPTVYFKETFEDGQLKFAFIY